MSNYTEKEKKIIKQCNKGPFHSLIIRLTNNEFEVLVSKLIIDDDSYTLTSLISIYLDYNRNKIIDYFINKDNVELLLGFLDYCNDFDTPNNKLDQKYIVDKLIEKNDKKFIKEILDNNSTYFLTDIKEKNRLLSFISKK